MASKSNVVFSADRVEEVRWDIVIDGQEVRILDKQLEEIVKRFLWSRKLKVVDSDDKIVTLKGIF
jgi:hypothetical protein